MTGHALKMTGRKENSMDTPTHIKGWTARTGIDGHGTTVRLVSAGTSKVAHIAALDSYGDSFMAGRRTGELVVACDRYFTKAWGSYGHYDKADIEYVLNVAEDKSFTKLCTNCVKVAKGFGLDLV
jgi:hypothetical protein